MRVKSLFLKNVRAIEAATFRFAPGFNVIAGVNGVGKTSVLHSLAVCLSAVIKDARRLGRYGALFQPEDVRVGAADMQASCEIDIGRSTHSYVVERRLPKDGMYGVKWAGDGKTTTRRPFSWSEDAREASPLAVLFSTARSVASDISLGRGDPTRGPSSAYAGALVNRRLKLGEFAAWIRVQQALMRERPESRRLLAALDAAIARFLPGYDNVRPGGSTSQDSLLIDHGDRTLPARLLSDGEKGALAIVFDLTRRLAQANEGMLDPARDAEAVVLIDEIELHLHPAWQRRIVGDLMKTFPRCQFIATTHSPQIIGEVEKERIQIMAGGMVYSPSHSFGVDSSRVLEEVMDAHARNVEIQELLRSISSRIDEDQYRDARKLLEQLAERVGEGDPEVTRARTLLEFLEDK